MKRMKLRHASANTQAYLKQKQDLQPKLKSTVYFAESLFKFNIAKKQSRPELGGLINFNVLQYTRFALFM
jgi:hypothetical protein